MTGGGVQKALILVKGGYTLDVTVVDAGKPVRLRFRRQETAACSERVLFPDFGRTAELPERRDRPDRVDVGGAGRVRLRVRHERAPRQARRRVGRRCASPWPPRWQLLMSRLSSLQVSCGAVHGPSLATISRSFVRDRSAASLRYTNVRRSCGSNVLVRSTDTCDGAARGNTVATNAAPLPLGHGGRAPWA